MQRSAVVLARCLAFVETFDLDPTGRVFPPDLVKGLVERYQFQKFPREFSDFDETKGVEFLSGKHGDNVIWQLRIFNTGIILDTRVNTKVSQELIEEALDWTSSNFGLSY